MKPYLKILYCTCLFICTFGSHAQNAYFIDGYHGGVYGHYPKGYTQFIVGKLNEHPFWKINLEIEPETWDSVAVWEPAALKQLQQLFRDQSATGRIEYVSPAYGQSYFFNTSGESIIRHFSYGIKKVKAYFPNAVFTTYSSEEPCFTSALPQILRSFGFRYASLKNPNTCWGGYTRAYGGELVNWIGPDGTKLITVPRYATEKLLPNSTWQTAGWTNSPQYIRDAFAYGIKNPVAMCLQDAGWKNGPWIGNGNRGYQPTYYKTWRDYIENHSIKTPRQNWKLSQEDILVSLVWGSQVLQQLAQRVRTAENKLVMAEKLAALAAVYDHRPWPKAAIDEAWRTLLLSQHHDCWIVPYNGKRGDTWADKVNVWTKRTNDVSDSIMHSAATLNDQGAISAIRVYNTTGTTRQELVQLKLPVGTASNEVVVVDEQRNEMFTQLARSSADHELYFKAAVPAMGFKTYRMEHRRPSVMKGATAAFTAEGNIILESDLYRLIIDRSSGGVIKSLIAKKLNNKEFVDQKNEKGFNALSGHFFNNGGFYTTSQNPVTLTMLENGPLVVKAAIKGMIFDHPFTQTITLKQGDSRIDCSLTITWKNNTGIGDAYKQSGGPDASDYHKPFYDDSKKLLALFPVNFSSQKIYKDAPFDVTESRLDNTFFTTWDSIKNNILLNWVDVYDAKEDYGLALFTDHTTTYAHGKGFPLGLNVQYSGAGLWGRDHPVTGTTEMKYALIPHKGKWDEGGISELAVHWNEPLVALPSSPVKTAERSLVDVTGTGYQVTAVLVEGDDLLVRLFNAAGNNKLQKIAFGGKATSARLEELNGAVKQHLKIHTGKTTAIHLVIPRFGIRTIRLKNFASS
ncbi:glycoside hydrolase family 38 C-terminal domain-containing protein [Longitalea luteola]|uniref:glycoside hydrolase family 38 C-terminal domain-containing protein n=1 Tax=Longitalea luteola TaxID=2812563 RepID=UPI001A96907B|nr:glycoside hydrolase family 38 C-terminal domain-containing protein [Longitalea luteola]